MAFYKYSTFTKLLSEKRFLAQLIKFGTCIDPNLGFISVDNFKDQAELSKTFKFIVAKGLSLSYPIFRFVQDKTSLPLSISGFVFV